MVPVLSVKNGIFREHVFAAACMRATPGAAYRQSCYVTNVGGVTKGVLASSVFQELDRAFVSHVLGIGARRDRSAKSIQKDGSRSYNLECVNQNKPPRGYQSR